MADDAIHEQPTVPNRRIHTRGGSPVTLSDDADCCFLREGHAVRFVATTIATNTVIKELYCDDPTCQRHGGADRSYSNQLQTFDDGFDPDFSIQEELERLEEQARERDEFEFTEDDKPNEDDSSLSIKIDTRTGQLEAGNTTTDRDVEERFKEKFLPDHGCLLPNDGPYEMADEVYVGSGTLIADLDADEPAFTITDIHDVTQIE